MHALTAVAACFALGTVLLLWGQRDGTGTGAASVPVLRESTAPPPDAVGLHGRAPQSVSSGASTAPIDDVAHRSEIRGSAAAATVTARDSRDVAGDPFATQLDVHVLGPDGALVTVGEVYALAAGASGGNDRRFVHDMQPENGHFGLSFVRDGRYDVGYVGTIDGGELHALVTDMRLERGARHQLTLRVPPPEPVHFEWTGATPLPDGHSIRINAQSAEGAVRFPGRNQEGAWDRGVLVERLPIAIPLVQAGRPWQVAAWLRGPSNLAPAPHLRASISPSQGRGSERVSIGIEVVPTVLLSFRGQKPQATERISVHVFDVAGEPVGYGAARWTADGLVGPIEIAGRPGPVRVEARTSRGVVGESSLTLPAVGRVVHDIHLEAPRPVPYTAVPINGALLPARTDALGSVIVLAAADGGAHPEIHAIPLQEEEVQTDWRKGTAVAVQGIDRASHPVRIAPGPLRFDLMPAGLLVVVPQRLFPESAGPFTLGREDGAPFAVRSHDWNDGVPSPDAVLEATVAPGLMLGPFPAGEVRFRVRVGGVALATATGTVVAGEMRPLVVEVR